MYQKLRSFARSLENEFDQISAERKEILVKLAGFIQVRYNKNAPINLIYICTHNSRRSHFGQVAAALAGAYYNIENLWPYSGGTEATAFNINAINALKKVGFEVNSTLDSANPLYNVAYSNIGSTTCFSKEFDDEANPKADFAAVMTCSEADLNCPIIPNALMRIATTYEDPKKADGTPIQDETYQSRFHQIASETFYAFSLVK